MELLLEELDTWIGIPIFGHIRYCQLTQRNYTQNG